MRHSCETWGYSGSLFHRKSVSNVWVLVVPYYIIKMLENLYNLQRNATTQPAKSIGHWATVRIVNSIFSLKQSIKQNPSFYSLHILYHFLYGTKLLGAVEK